MEDTAIISRTSQSVLKGRSVLVADDSQTLRSFLKRPLVKKGMRVTEAADGISAVCITRWFRPDIILLDLNLPQISGFDVLGRIANSDELFDIPVIIVSGIYDEATKSRAHSLGAAGFIEKPVNLDELFSVIEKILEGKQE